MLRLYRRLAFLTPFSFIVSHRMAAFHQTMAVQLNLQLALLLLMVWQLGLLQVVQ
jgi:hypothetical protein